MRCWDRSAPSSARLRCSISASCSSSGVPLRKNRSKKPNLCGRRGATLAAQTSIGTGEKEMFETRARQERRWQNPHLRREGREPPPREVPQGHLRPLAHRAGGARPGCLPPPHRALGAGVGHPESAGLSCTPGASRRRFGVDCSLAPVPRYTGLRALRTRERRPGPGPRQYRPPPCRSTRERLATRWKSWPP